MKLWCINIVNGNLQTNTYKAPSGTSYQFNKFSPTDVPKKEDAEFFLKASKGKSFVKHSDFKKPPEPAVGTKGREPPKTAQSGRATPYKIHSHKELKDMNKAEQVRLIKKYAGVDASIPRYEYQRIKLIQELEKGGK